MTAEEKPPLTDDEEIAILFPQPIELKIGSGGLKFAVLPMDTRTCMKFIQKARPVFKKAEELAGGAKQDGESQFKNIIAAAADHQDEFFDALSIATGRTAELIGKLPPGASTALAYLVWQANIDFFVQNVGNLAFGVLATLQGKTGDGAGLTH